MKKTNRHILLSIHFKVYALAVFLIRIVLLPGIVSQDTSNATVIENVRVFDGKQIIPGEFTLYIDNVRLK